MSPVETIRKYVERLSKTGHHQEDPDEIRIAKTIWRVALGFAIPLSAVSAIVFLLIGAYEMTPFMFFVALYWQIQVFVFERQQRAIELHGLFSQLVLIIGSFVTTLLLGGIWQSAGVVFFGMMAPVYALAFPKLKKAWFMLALFSSLSLSTSLWCNGPVPSSCLLPNKNGLKDCC